MPAASARTSSGMSRLPSRISSLLFVELVPFLVGHPGDAQADQHGRSDQNQDSTLKRRNHAGTGARRLRIAERAILSVSKRRNGQRRNQGGPSGGDSCSLVPHTAHFLSATWRVSLPPRARSIPWRKWGSSAPLSPLPLGACSVRERPHMQQADAVRPDHIHHQQDEDRGRNQRKEQTALLLRKVHEIHQAQGRAADSADEEN